MIQWQVSKKGNSTLQCCHFGKYLLTVGGDEQQYTAISTSILNISVAYFLEHISCMYVHSITMLECTEVLRHSTYYLKHTMFAIPGNSSGLTVMQGILKVSTSSDILSQPSLWLPKCRDASDHSSAMTLSADDIYNLILNKKITTSVGPCPILKGDTVCQHLQGNIYHLGYGGHVSIIEHCWVCCWSIPPTEYIIKNHIKPTNGQAVL